MQVNRESLYEVLADIHQKTKKNISMFVLNYFTNDLKKKENLIKDESLVRNFRKKYKISQNNTQNNFNLTVENSEENEMSLFNLSINRHGTNIPIKFLLFVGETILTIKFSNCKQYLIFRNRTEENL